MNNAQFLRRAAVNLTRAGLALCLLAQVAAAPQTDAESPADPGRGAPNRAAGPPRAGRLSFGWGHERIVPGKPVAVAGQYHTRISGEVLEQQIAKAVISAWQSRKPGAFSHALSHASVARNRRAVFFDGTTRLYGDTKDPGFSHLEGASDDSIDVLGFWRDNKIVGLAIRVYCPSQQTEGLPALSADFWHETRQLLRELHSPGLFVLGLTGASGDQSPHIQIEDIAGASTTESSVQKAAESSWNKPAACCKRCGPQDRHA
jgi:hypothetical protein